MTLTLEQRTVGGWSVPTVRFADEARGLELRLSGEIVNSITTSQRAKDAQLAWKRTIATEVKGARGGGPWDARQHYAVSLAMRFCPALHGNRSDFDVENFVKPVLDGLAAGLFCPPDQDPRAIGRFNYDDSGFSTLFIHRLPDAPHPDDEGVAIRVSAAPR